MNRFNLELGFMEQSEEGRYVLHSDHAAELARVEAANALLRAECEAWRRAAYGRALIDLYSSSSESIWPARAATDAAGILKGGE